MGQDKKTPVTINDVEYQYEDLTAEQQTLFNHCLTLTARLVQLLLTLTRCK